MIRYTKFTGFNSQQSVGKPTIGFTGYLNLRRLMVKIRFNTLPHLYRGFLVVSSIQVFLPKFCTCFSYLPFALYALPISSS